MIFSKALLARNMLSFHLRFCLYGIFGIEKFPFFKLNLSSNLQSSLVFLYTILLSASLFWSPYISHIMRETKNFSSTSSSSFGVPIVERVQEIENHCCFIWIHWYFGPASQHSSPQASVRVYVTLFNLLSSLISHSHTLFHGIFWYYSSDAQ